MGSPRANPLKAMEALVEKTHAWARLQQRLGVRGDRLRFALCASATWAFVQLPPRMVLFTVFGNFPEVRFCLLNLFLFKWVVELALLGAMPPTLASSSPPEELARHAELLGHVLALLRKKKRVFVPGLVRIHALANSASLLVASAFLPLVCGDAAPALLMGGLALVEAAALCIGFALHMKRRQIRRTAIDALVADLVCA